MIQGIRQFLVDHEIMFQTERLQEYMTDASFLTRGEPSIVIFLHTEDQAFKVVDYMAKGSIPVAIRAMGSSTAGAALADRETPLLLVENLGMCDPWGNRTIFLQPRLFTSDGEALTDSEMDKLRSRPELLREVELFARVPAGMSTDELDRSLIPYHLHSAIVPSSGWTSIAANFSTNAGGNGSPTYGTFKDTVNRMRIIGTDGARNAKIYTVAEKSKIISMAGHQGLLGIITELDVRVVYAVPEEELLSAVVWYQHPDISMIGQEVGLFMDKAQRNCRMINAEFLLLDPYIIDDGNPVFQDPELKGFFALEGEHRKMLVLYQGERGLMDRLPEVARSFSGIHYQEISAQGLKKMLEVRKAAAGKSFGRVGVPGFEDIFVRDPKKLGKVLAKIFEMSEGILPGRPYGHQYVDGLVIHYRPLARLQRSEFEKARALTEELGREIFDDPDYATEKRAEHGLGFELFSRSSKQRIEELTSLKKEFDPAAIFSPFLMSPRPTIDFSGDRLLGIAAP
jgi:FAD/FMN-containing dehydrogenase